MFREESVSNWKATICTMIGISLLGLSPVFAEGIVSCSDGMMQIGPQQVQEELVMISGPADAHSRFECGPQGHEGWGPDVVTGVPAEAAVAFSPAPSFGLFAGYRFLEKDAVKMNASSDTQFDGPYVGALIRF
jgi:hypothetical protein